MEALFRLHRGLTRYDSQVLFWGGSLLSLAIRCFVGWQFLKAGLLKLEDWENTIALFTDEYHVPLLPPSLAAVLGTFGEVSFPTLLFLGLLVRPAALGLFFVNAVAVISYPQLLHFECPAAINDHFYWGCLLLVLTVLGAGRFGVDHYLGKRQPGPPVT